MSSPFKNYKENNPKLIELVNQYASDELKSNDRYFDVLTDIISVCLNTDILWKNFNKRSAEYKQTILNEKLTLEFLQIYNKTRDELNCYQSFGSSFYTNDTGLIFYGFFHHILSAYPSNKEIITEISKIIPLRYCVSFNNNKSKIYSLFDFIAEDLKNDSDFVESIIYPIPTESIESDTYFLDISVLLCKTNLKSNFDFIYKINRQLKIISSSKHLYIFSIKPPSMEERELYDIYANKRNSFEELNKEINTTSIKTPSKKKMKI